MKLLPWMGGAAVLAASMTATAEQTPSVEELWKLVQQQQAQIEALQAELRSTRSAVAQTEQQVQRAEEQVAASQEIIEAAEAAVEDLAAAPNAAGWAENTYLGGYGELHYNAGDADEIDFHRFVLFVNHEFSDRLRFNSELEIEHALAGDGQPGEVELEQAYIEYDLSPQLRAKGGLFLIPTGILNEVHEPNTFCGVERNPVENRIIPSTWWEAGAALTGEFGDGFGWDAAVHSGLATNAGASYAIRSGRQKVAEAIAKDAAFTARLRYTGIPGLRLAASFQHQQDVTQSADPTAGAARLFETHAIYTVGGFGLRALYARWDLDGAGPEAIGADVQDGFYIEPSYKVSPNLGFFARYNEWDNRAGDSADSQWRQTDIGVNYWPHANVVLKADYQFQDGPGDNDGDDRLNLGIGYQF